jgi:tRNA dimethylallyltransferase
MNKPVIFLIGPTAVGKSQTAYHLAKKINAEIISCDSMQVYKGMDIGTSKPEKKLRKEIPHHLIDVISPDEEFNVAKYQSEVASVIDKIYEKGKLALISGGTGLYMKVLLDGIFKEKEGSLKIREGLKKQAENKGLEFLYQELKRLDPEAAEIVHPRDARRIIRALEFYHKTKRTISEAKKTTRGILKDYKVRIFGLSRSREELYQRINKRVDAMFEKGLVDEVIKLNKKYNLSKTAKEALGYKEILKFLKGKFPLDEAKELIKRNTRRLAKRQLTWFKKDARVEWIEVEDKEGPEETAGKIYGMIKDEI